MSCSPFDLRDYFVQELPSQQALQVEEHIRQCARCREEMERLTVTQTALLALRDEEVPRRFALSPGLSPETGGWRGWFGAFWNSTPRLGFASACVLAIAVVVYAVAPHSQPALTAGSAVAAVASASGTDVQKQLQAAVDKAVSDLKAQQAQEVQVLVAGYLKQQEEDRQKLKLAADQLAYVDHHEAAIRSAAYRMGPAGGGAQ